VLLLYAWADLTYEQVARALDLPVGTVRSRIARARTSLTAGAKPSPSFGDAKEPSRV